MGVPFVAGLLLGAVTSANSSPGSDCPECAGAAGFLIGAGLGAVAASVIDAVWLAREPVTQPEAARTLVVPSVAWAKGRDGAQHPALGLLAAF